jgi:hypothetical protein
MNIYLELNLKLKNGLNTSKSKFIAKILNFLKMLTFLTIFGIFVSDEQRFCAKYKEK